jgi:hypothetical protein
VNVVCPFPRYRPPSRPLSYPRSHIYPRPQFYGLLGDVATALPANALLSLPRADRVVLRRGLWEQGPDGTLAPLSFDPEAAAELHVSGAVEPPPYPARRLATATASGVSETGEALNPLPVVRALLSGPGAAPPAPPPSDLSSVALESELNNKTLQLGNKALERAKEGGAAVAAQAERVGRLAQSIKESAVPGDRNDPWVRLGQMVFWVLIMGSIIVILHGILLYVLAKKGKEVKGPLVFGRLEIMVRAECSVHVFLFSCIFLSVGTSVVNLVIF